MFMVIYRDVRQKWNMGEFIHCRSEDRSLAEKEGSFGPLSLEREDFKHTPLDREMCVVDGGTCKQLRLMNFRM